jgi:hypothetical protein
MKENNFFVKFIYWYIANIKTIMDYCEDIKDIFLDDILPWLFRIIVVIIRVLECILPVYILYEAFATEWVTDEKMAKLLKGKYKGRYTLKKEVRKIEAEVETAEKLKNSDWKLIDIKICTRSTNIYELKNKITGETKMLTKREYEDLIKC